MSQRRPYRLTAFGTSPVATGEANKRKVSPAAAGEAFIV